jgi:phosphinothricin acetyltransferase
MNLQIRQAMANDAPAVAAVYAPFVTDACVSFEEQAPDAAEMARRITGTLQKYPYLVACDGDQVVGYAYACEHRPRVAYRWSVDSALYLKTTHHRRGVGRALYNTLFSLLLKQNYVNVYAGVTLPIPASVAIHESFGFVPVGINRATGYKKNAWHDVGWWQKQLQPPPAHPAEPISWQQMPKFEPIWRPTLQT